MQGFIGGILTKCPNLMSDRKRFFCEAFQNLNFMVTGLSDFSAGTSYASLTKDPAEFADEHLLIISKDNCSSQKKIGYNIDILRQTACLVVNPIKLTALLASLIAER